MKASADERKAAITEKIDAAGGPRLNRRPLSLDQQGDGWLKSQLIWATHTYHLTKENKYNKR